MTVVDAQVQKWRAWIEGPIHNDIIDLHHKRQVWREVGDMLDASPVVARTPSAFWDWISENYVTALAVGIRRQADRDPRTSSLPRLIEEMRDDAPPLTRAYFLSLWREPGDGHMMRRADAAFDALAGAERADLDPAVPAADLAMLRSDSSRMARYVNEHVAHLMAEPTMTELPTFGDLHNAFDVLGSMFKKYANLLTAGSYVTLEPVMQDDWKAIFRRPWLAAESREH